MNYSVDIQALSGLALIDLRGDKVAAAAFADTLAVGLPAQTGRTATHDEFVVMALGPDHWLVQCRDEQQHALLARLQRSVEDKYAAVTIVSDHLRGYRLRGDSARDILAQACSLDLDAFNGGKCARCAFARTTAVVRVIEAGHVYDVFVESSYRAYIDKWFEMARGPGCGAPVQAG